eukprot:6243922-Amphidinium_carterae.1
MMHIGKYFLRHHYMLDVWELLHGAICADAEKAPKVSVADQHAAKYRSHRMTYRWRYVFTSYRKANKCID